MCSRKCKQLHKGMAAWRQYHEAADEHSDGGCSSPQAQGHRAYPVNLSAAASLPSHMRAAARQTSEHWSQPIPLQTQLPVTREQGRMFELDHQTAAAAPQQVCQHQTGAASQQTGRASVAWPSECRSLNAVQQPAVLGVLPVQQSAAAAPLPRCVPPHRPQVCVIVCPGVPMAAYKDVGVPGKVRLQSALLSTQSEGLSLTCRRMPQLGLKFQRVLATH